jgi:tetratricopeptide (TPR) repeat protein
MAVRRYSAASASFRAALALSPHEPRYEFGLALSLLTDGLSQYEDELSRALGDLASTANSPEEEALVAESLLKANRSDDALRRGEHAVRTDSRCTPCAKTLAEVLHARGDDAGAVRVIERALSAWPESAADRELLDALKIYRLAARPERK